MGLALEILWCDEHVVEVRVQCGNGRFMATADCYVGHHAFAELATALRGFPASREDRREFKLGTLDPSYGGGGLHLLLECLDAAGHAAVHVRLRSSSDASDCASEDSATFSFPLEAAALDAFVARLGRMPVTPGAAAQL